MAKFLNYDGIKEFLNKIINSPDYENSDYWLGIKDGKIVRIYNPYIYTVYKFVGSSSGDSTVVIDGSNITVPANGTVEGVCSEITGITTNNLKEIYVTGRFSDGISLAGNTTLEILELSFPKNYERSFEDFCYNCSGLKTVKITGSKATDLYRLFFQCENLEDVEVNGIDTSSCTDMRYVFYHCESLSPIDVSGWDTSKVTSMTQMFSYTYSNTTLDLSGFNTSACTAMNGMFRENRTLVTLDLSGFDASKVEAFNAMFRECYALTNLYLGDNWDMGAATNVDNMFLSCNSLENVTGTISNIKLSIDLSYSPLTRESALVFINGLGNVSGQTISLSSTTKSLLTDADKKIATDKGWTIN